MAGFIPDEGEAFVASLLYNNVNTDRGTDMELGCFTNVAPGDTITEATITEPTGTGYARIDLTDGSWIGAASLRSYAKQTFQNTNAPGGADWVGQIQGYFICTKGTTKRLINVEVDPNGPYTMTPQDTYGVTPNNTISDSLD